MPEIYIEIYVCNECVVELNISQIAIVNTLIKFRQGCLWTKRIVESHL